VRAVVLHEPALFALFDDPGAVRKTLTTLIGEALAAGDPRAAFARFLRFVVGEATWRRIDTTLRE
jgi:hypothetical protein